MANTQWLIEQVAEAASRLGLTGAVPAPLSAGGNLILHLLPYPVVARFSLIDSGHHARQAAERELSVARHLQIKGVPALAPTELVPAGPHPLGDAWMTLWQHIPATELPPPSPEQAQALVASLSVALADYPGELPRLAVWNRTAQSAQRLNAHPDQRVQGLLRRFRAVDQQLRQPGLPLAPSHGDAHSRNLIASPSGWSWMDFEDACLMPPAWDAASFIANLALFGGLQHPTVSRFLQQAVAAGDGAAWRQALTARVLMSVLGNLDFALAGHGDLDFARHQLERAEGLLNQIDGLWQEK